MHRSAVIVPFRLLSARFSIQIRSFAQFFRVRLQYFCIQYWDNEVFLQAKIFKIMNFADE